MSAYREWRERVAKGWRKPPLPPEVLDAQRVYEQDVVQFWDDRKAGDQTAIDRNKLYESEITAAECRAGIHDDCVHEEAHDDNEYMSPMGYAARPVGVVWGTVNPDGSVTARGFRDDESYFDDTAVHPPMSLVAYHPDDNTWVHAATGQTMERQREIDAKRADQAERAEVDVSTGTTTGHSSSLWWLDGKDTSAMSFNEVSELATQTGDLRDEMQRQGDPPERIAEVDREYQRLVEAQQAAGQRMKERVGRADTPPPAEGADVNEATKGAIEGVSTITPTGLATSVASGVTGKNIKSPLATAVGSTSGGGSGVSDAEQGNAKIQQAGQDIETAMGAIQEIVSNLEAAQQNLTGAAEGSQHSEADTAMGALQQAVQAANDLQQQVGAAKQAVEDVKL